MTTDVENATETIPWETQHDTWQQAETVRRLHNIRHHAKTLQEMIEAPYENDLMNTRIYRALYISQGAMVAASLHQIKGGNPPMVAQVQCRFAETAPVPAAQQLHGVALTPTEIAVFFGLDDVDAQDVKWVEQKFDTKGLAIVRSSLPELQARKH